MAFKKSNSFYLLLTLTFLIISCKKESSEKLRTYYGETQGTTYSIKVISNQKVNLKPQIDSVLQAVDLTFSNYNKASLLSKINSGNDSIEVNDMFKEVFKTSEKIHSESGKLFDPTVGVLVKAWGFGTEQNLNEPSQQKIDSLLIAVGFDKLSILPNNKLAKCCPNIYLDFNAIAQGYTSDRIAVLLKQKGFDNFMIEIGGEIYASGYNTLKNKPWIVGIDNPLQKNNDRKIIEKVSLTNLGLATSGNYRKFRIDPKSGKKYAHTINPKTGYPKMTNILSATVLAPNSMEADGYATAFMLMDLEDTQRLLLNHKELAVLILYLDENNQLKKYTNKTFERLIVKD